MIELEVIPACRAFGLGLIPWSPLAGGILGGTLQDVKEGRRFSENGQKKLEQFRPQIEAYEGLCVEMGEKPADVALAWMLHNPAVTSPIIGPRTLSQLEGSLHTLEMRFSDEVLGKLDAIWPGPGGEAPEAYAW
jgi:aryl-alcohol dehydrogenase-like predicted oxidoreductase